MVGISTLVFVSGNVFADRWAARGGSSSGGAASVCFLADGLDPVAVQQAELAALTWNLATTALNVGFGQCDSDSDTVTLANGSLDSGVLGNAKWATSGGTIVSARILFDDSQIAMWSGGSSMEDAWRGVTCHEMGHALGLAGHSEDPDSCMQTGKSTPTLTPAESDMEMIRSLYGGEAKQGSVPQVQGQANTNSGQIPAANSFNGGVAQNPAVTQGPVVAPQIDSGAPASVTGQVIPYQYQPQTQLPQSSVPQTTIAPPTTQAPVIQAPGVVGSTGPAQTNTAAGASPTGSFARTYDSANMTVVMPGTPVLPAAPSAPLGGCCACGNAAHCGQSVRIFAAR